MYNVARVVIVRRPPGSVPQTLFRWLLHDDHYHVCFCVYVPTPTRLAAGAFHLVYETHPCPDPPMIT